MKRCPLLALVAIVATSLPSQAQDPAPDWTRDATVGRLDRLRGVSARPGESIPTGSVRTAAPGAPVAVNPTLRAHKPLGSVQPAGGVGCPDPLDCDGDGLADALETAGWQIVFDEFGYGPAASIDLLTIATVTSNPSDPDSDDDGLGDLQEYIIGTHPGLADTDGDGLTDDVEWTKWLTSPNSIDTDADARGPSGELTPNAMLFDGAELNAVDGLSFDGVPRTSPTLADTDGDGMTDFEEFAHPFFRPLVADLPRSTIEIVGEPSIRLDVEYVESVGQATEYGSSLASSSSKTQANSWGHTFDVMVGMELETEANGSFVPPSLGTKTGLTITGEVAYGHSWDLTQESTQETSAEHSRYQSDSLELTESFASGSLSVPVRLRNDGQFSFTLNSLGITALRWTPPLDLGPGETVPGAFDAMATLTPDLDDITLAPGEATPILQVQAEDVNPDVIKAFMANPSSLVLSPAVFNLVTADGIDFDFITENTFSRTAVIEISYGAGDVETHRVATNVDRDGFTYSGITLADALEQILDIEEAATPGADAYTLDEYMIVPDGQAPLPTGLRAITSIRGRENIPGPTVDAPLAFWTVAGNDLPFYEFDLDGDGTPDDRIPSFDEITLKAGDSVQVYYTRDQDADGLYAFQEQFYGTSDLDEDSDGDGLGDLEEVKGFWVGEGDLASLLPEEYPKQVYTNPVLDDTDNDGLSDADELDVFFTDPTSIDTDRDSILDEDDVFPTIPAARLYVTATGSVANEGLSWNDAMTLDAALTEAQTRNTNAIDDDDIGEIWVARHTYQTTSAADSFVLPVGARVLGGFVGDELLASERDPDPATNQTVLSGAYTFGSGSHHVVTLPLTPGTCTLDGFVIAGGDGDGGGSDDFGGGLYAAFGSADGVFRNLLIKDNEATVGGGGSWVGSNCVFESCVFQDNVAPRGGGIAVGTFAEDGDVVIDDCRFKNNIANESGGALFSVAQCSLTLEGTQFDGNIAVNEDDFDGGGAWLVDGAGRAVNCEFVGNRSGIKATSNFSGAGAIEVTDATAGELILTNCLIDSNDGGEAGAIYTLRRPIGSTPRLIQLTNCTVVRNQSWAYADGTAETSPSMVIDVSGTVYNYGVFGSGGIFQNGTGDWANTFTLDATATEHDQPSNVFVITNSVLYGNRNGAATFPPSLGYIDNVFGNAKSGAWAQIRTTAGIYFIGSPYSMPPGTETNDIPVSVFDRYYLGDSVQLKRSVVEWGTVSGVTPEDVSAPTLESTLNFTNLTPDAGTFDAAFVDFVGADYRPAPGSPLIDAGDNVVDTDLSTLLFDLLPATDIDGKPRIVDIDGDSEVDIGAHEFQGDT